MFGNNSRRVWVKWIEGRLLCIFRTHWGLNTEHPTTGWAPAGGVNFGGRGNGKRWVHLEQPCLFLSVCLLPVVQLVASADHMLPFLLCLTGTESMELRTVDETTHSPFFPSVVHEVCCEARRGLTITLFLSRQVHILSNYNPHPQEMHINLLSQKAKA